MISLNQMTAGYGSAQPVLEGITLQLEPGRIHGLVGMNGAGKTTLLRVLAGQVDAKGGAQVFGEDPFDNPRTLGRTVLMGIDVPLPDSWSGKKLLEFGQARYSTWDARRAEELVERFSLPEATLVGMMSRGQRSALSVIYAFAANCELTLLDEPYLGLDVNKRHAFYETLREERGRSTIVFATHHLHDSENLLNTITLIRAGNLALTGPITGLTEEILAITGTSEAVSATLEDIPAPLLIDASIGGARRAVLDLRESPAMADDLWGAAGVSISTVSLDESVRALMEVAK